MTLDEFPVKTPYRQVRLPKADWIDKNSYDDKYTVTFSAISTFEPLFDESDIDDNHAFTDWCQKEGLVPEGVKCDSESCQSFFDGTEKQLEEFLVKLSEKLLELDGRHEKAHHLL